MKLSSLNVMKILLISRKNKTKIPGKNGSVWFICKKLQVISTICKLSECQSLVAKQV